jgi:hypothetical protein
MTSATTTQLVDTRLAPRSGYGSTIMGC